MNSEGFQEHLRAQKFTDEVIEQHISTVKMFASFLDEKYTGRSTQTPGSADINAFSEYLIDKKLNTIDNFIAIARYNYFTGNYEAYIATVELLDGSEALANLYERVGKTLGEKKQAQIFNGIELPPLGTPSAQKPAVTAKVMDRLVSMVDNETNQKIFSTSLRDLNDEWYQAEKQKFHDCGDIDAYLKRKGQAFLVELEKIKHDGGLYFTQEITNEVIEFVRDHPEISQGVRVGNVIYEVKIPNMTKEYLVESDEQMKKYYYCHCPWVRESLKKGDVQVSTEFCKCSAGFHKKQWEVIFEQPLQAEVVESVLKGDLWCNIAIYLPENV